MHGEDLRGIARLPPPRAAMTNLLSCMLLPRRAPRGPGPAALLARAGAFVRGTPAAAEPGVVDGCSLLTALGVL